MKCGKSKCRCCQSDSKPVIDPVGIAVVCGLFFMVGLMVGMAICVY